MPKVSSPKASPPTVSSPPASPARHLDRRNLRLDWLLFFGIVLLAVVEFNSFLTSWSFGPEYTQFYGFVHDRSFGQIMHSYLTLNSHWYRPTQFAIPFWIGQHFISWRDPQGWRAYELFTMLVVCGLIYWLVLTLLPGRRIAAFTAALYFTCVPVIYVPLFELFGFDFLHVLFSLLSVIGFTIGYRLRTWRGVGWTALALVSYTIALTSKEIAIVIPIYLTVVSAVLYFYEPGPENNKARLLREVKRLAPFFLMTVVYWWLHIRQIPEEVFKGNIDYRIGANWPLILQNAIKYPLWFARIYGYTPDTMNQAAGYQNWRNDLTGGIALLVVCYACIRLWRADRVYRKYILLAVAWIAVFLMVPVYSGGYFWHGNLALCGYCMLFGVALDWGVTHIKAQAVRFAVLALVIGALVQFTRMDAAACLTSGMHSESFRINSTVLQQPPIPFERMQDKSLVKILAYVEDRKDLGWFNFGAGTLFNVVYLKPKLLQVMVPAMDKVTRAQCLQWLNGPNPVFFRYDDNYRWYDATDEFRAFAKKKLSEPVILPTITSVTPSETRAGVGFNVQSNGFSAIGVTGSHFEPGAEILINGQKQPTVMGANFMSTIIPKEAYARPGNISVQVRNPGDVDSEPFLIRVR